MRLCVCVVSSRQFGGKYVLFGNFLQIFRDFRILHTGTSKHCHSMDMLPSAVCVRVLRVLRLCLSAHCLVCLGYGYAVLGPDVTCIHYGGFGCIRYVNIMWRVNRVIRLARLRSRLRVCRAQSRACAYFEYDTWCSRMSLPFWACNGGGWSRMCV